ncbi:hypothetical protein ED312_03000 [Sinomicrobium pectinilyticum]|uniref:Uncharacterized protein n=1 Tax=Sinomicrobium pectinilyticum TaxID=1084421 RepID=A0A3N0EYL6_SINP1|nr:hypothetical protein ED312_03000 [Sinomicrobium pectinilyticum]
MQENEFSSQCGKTDFPGTKQNDKEETTQNSQLKKLRNFYTCFQKETALVQVRQRAVSKLNNQPKIN